MLENGSWSQLFSLEDGQDYPCGQGKALQPDCNVNPGIQGNVNLGKSVEAACEPGGVTHFLQPKVHFTTNTSSKSGRNWLLAQLDFALFVEKHYPYLGWSCWDMLMQKTGLTVACLVWKGRGQGALAVMENRSWKIVASAKLRWALLLLRAIVYLPTFRKSKAGKCKRMEKSSQTSNRKRTDQSVLVPSYPSESLKQEFI